MKVGDRVSVYNYWFKNAPGTVIDISDGKIYSDRTIQQLGPFVNIRLDNGEISGMIPKSVCTPLKEEKLNK